MSVLRFGPQIRGMEGDRIERLENILAFRPGVGENERAVMGVNDTGPAPGVARQSGVQDKRDGEKPLLQRHVGAMKNRADSYAKRGLAIVTKVPPLIASGAF